MRNGDRMTGDLSLPGRGTPPVWLPALKAAGLPAIHFHDLGHTGNTLAANAGASLRELMERMDHDSERAALIYLHSSDERQHQIADTLSRLATEELKRGVSARAHSPRGDRARHGHAPQD